MTREEAIQKLIFIGDEVTSNSQAEAIDMAIEALQTHIVRCENCKYQDECEEVVLFDINDDEVIGHRVCWCSYGRSE